MPGQRALLWLLKSGAVSDLAYLSHPTFLKAVAHCLVAENGLRYLFHWIMVEDNLFALVDVKLGRGNSFWRGRLLRYTTSEIIKYSRVHRNALLRRPRP